METLYLKAFSPHLRLGMLKSAITGLQDYGVHLPLNSGHVTYFFWKCLKVLTHSRRASPAITLQCLEGSKVNSQMCLS